ncbi:MAG: glycosyltransferase family 2 protein, partial [Isosphaeraceae bacterium]
MVDAHPDILLITAEPKSYPENPVIRVWSDWILDPSARARAFELMSTHVFLNSGFAAGTASALLSYLREGDRLLNSHALLGVDDWGDQVALNVYCHRNPSCWKTIERGWNYTLAGQETDEYRITLDGRAKRLAGGPVHVLHGNDRSLRWL